MNLNDRDEWYNPVIFVMDVIVAHKLYMTAHLNKFSKIGLATF